MVPTEAEWRTISRGFDSKWNFPHAVGALDGKHVMSSAERARVRAGAGAGAGLWADTELVKENTSWAARRRRPLAARWLAAGGALVLAALLLAAWLDQRLPAPRAPHTAPHLFSGLRAHSLLENLTAIGPRVAGSYNNEVRAVAAVLAAARAAAAGAAPHNAVELDLHRASGAFSLAFLDGMNNIYRDVQSVVVRVRGAGAGAGAGGRRRPALLLNCHFDTVPDSPGASDDGAGCAVLLETLRALAAGGPLARDAVFLFNGAEENIMQASHAFITTHKWAGAVRVFVNLEACGAGGREVVFQAGPRDPWLLELYAAHVPRPFASSLAQELFESGLVPADTDFRVFRDYGGLSGLDLAWSANGYVYHTALDTAARAPPAALQRTGDNVLALVHAVLASEEMDTAADPDARPPVFFDLLGRVLLTARPPAAAAAALATLSAALLAVHRDACAARKELYVSRRRWWRGVGATLAGAGAALAVGVGVAAGAALLLHAAGARLPFYANPWLLAPLYALPAVVVWGYCVRRWAGGADAGGWWAARRAMGAALSGWALMLLLGALRPLRSAFVPLTWTLPLAAALLAADLTRASEGARLAWWCAGSLAPLLQTWSLAWPALIMFVPLTGRSGAPAVPPAVSMAVLTAVVSLAASWWLLPLVAAARGGVARGGRAAAGAAAAVWLLAASAALLLPAYSPARPQRVMLLHVRVTSPAADGALQHEHRYWLPHLDPNTPDSMKDHVPELAALSFEPAGCSLWPYCGAPYYLPVLELVGRGYWLPAPAHPAPAVTLQLAAGVTRLNHTTQLLQLDVRGPSHVVLIVAPVEGARVSWASPLAGPPREGAPWGGRRTYFLALHDAAAEGRGGPAPAHWTLTLHITHSFPEEARPAQWATLSAAGHGMARPRAAPHSALLARLPPWAVPTGWGVHLQLLTV